MKQGVIEFHEIFIVMEKLSSPIIGLIFLQRNHTVLDMRQGKLNFPFFSMQLKTGDHKYSNVMEPILNPEDVIIPPNDYTDISIQSQIYAENAVTGILQPSDLLSDENDVTFCAAIVTLNEGTTRIHVNNFTEQPFKLKKGLHIASFSVMTPEQMKHVRPTDPVSTWHLLNENGEDAICYISSLLKANRNNDQYEQYWFPPPENPGDETAHTPIQKRILRELRNLQGAEILNPQEDAESRQKVISNERTHASLKTNLKMASGEYRRQWHKYLPLAVLNYNTTYHSSIGCEPSNVFHGRILFNVLDHKLGNYPNKNFLLTTEFAEEVQQRTQILIDQTKKNIMQSYLKYKDYYDRKAKAAPLR